MGILQRCRIPELCLFLLSSPLYLAAVPSAPETGAGGAKAADLRVRELAEVLSRGPQSEIRQFISVTFSDGFLEAIPLDRHVEILTRSSTQQGGFKVASVVPLSPNRVSAAVQGVKTGEWFRIILEVEPAPPHKIASIGISPSGAPSELPIGGATDEAMVESLKALVEKAAAEGRFSGAVLLAKGEQVLLKAAFGEASKRYGVPNRIDTKFNLGSMNKMFTAVAIAQLAEKGLLSFDDPVSNYLADWIPAEAAGRIRISHLLTHTSGLGSYFNEKFMNSSRLLYRDLKDYKPLVSGETPAFEPGSRWQYSNTGFLLLGAVIEKVTGKSYFDYIREHVYKPAGMVNSDSYEVDVPVPNLAMGYLREAGGQIRENTLMHVVKGGPAGGGYSTVEDLHRFALVLRSGKLLSPKFRDLVTSAKPEANSPGYGYGFQVDSQLETLGHSGGFPGISAQLTVYKKEGFVLAVLCNYGQGGREIVEHLQALVFARR